MKTVTYWIYEVETKHVRPDSWWYEYYEKMYEGEIEVPDDMSGYEIARQAMEDARVHYMPYRKSDGYDIANAKIQVSEVGEFWLDEFDTDSYTALSFEV